MMRRPSRYSIAFANERVSMWSWRVGDGMTSNQSPACGKERERKRARFRRSRSLRIWEAVWMSMSLEREFWVKSVGSRSMEVKVGFPVDFWSNGKAVSSERWGRGGLSSELSMVRDCVTEEMNAAAQ